MARPNEVVEFIRLVSDAETQNRAEALEDLRFRFGDQWPAEILNARKLQDRPALTINETDAYIRQVVNQLRQQRPRIKAHPIDSKADPKIAEVITGLTRHVEVNSDAANAYDLAAEFAVTMGTGYWRLRTDYIREDSFDQDIYIDQVENVFSVYFDTASSLPDGSDAERAAITDMMAKRAFLKQYPGAMMGGFEARATGDMNAEWMTKEDIRLAEYYYIVRKPSELVMLSDRSTYYIDEMPPAELLERAGLAVVGTRPSYKRTVKWCKVSAFETLEEKDIPGRWIPVVPMYGVNIVIDGKRQRFGLVRFAKDPQRMLNFWQTCITESVALAPKPKWLGAEGFDEGHENEWAQANNSALARLVYKQTGVDGKEIPPPQRIAPEPPPEGAMMAAMQAGQNLRAVMGVYDPGARASANHKSDKTINAEAQQTEITNYHFYDNETRSIKHTGRIILGWTPKIWDTERVQRIIGADGRAKVVTLNQRAQKVDDATGQAIQTVLNDVTVGTYDAEMEVGPGYNSRRQEAVAMFMELMNTPLGEKIAGVADDIIVRQTDVPGADAVADRLAAANPLAQIDEDSDIPPKVQMMVKGLQDQLQKAMQALQQVGLEQKFGLQKEQMRQEGETKRTLITSTTKAHDIETLAATKRHDTEMRALTTQNAAEIKGIVDLLLAHVDTKHLEMELAQRDREQEAKAAQDAALPQPEETQGA